MGREDTSFNAYSLDFFKYVASTLDNSPTLIIVEDKNWNVPSTKLYDFTFKNKINKNNSKETSKAFAR